MNEQAPRCGVRLGACLTYPQRFVVECVGGDLPPLLRLAREVLRPVVGERLPQGLEEREPAGECGASH